MNDKSQPFDRVLLLFLIIIPGLGEWQRGVTSPTRLNKILGSS